MISDSFKMVRKMMITGCRSVCRLVHFEVTAVAELLSLLNLSVCLNEKEEKERDFH